MLNLKLVILKNCLITLMYLGDHTLMSLVEVRLQLFNLLGEVRVQLIK